MFTAPEIFDGQRYNTAVDVYSFAVTVFECVCGRGHTREQFRSVPGGNISVAICSGWRPKPTYIVKENIPLVLDLLQECWRSEKSEVKGGLASLLAPDIAKRPTFTAIVERLESMMTASSTQGDQQISLASQVLSAFADVTITEIEQARRLQNSRTLTIKSHEIF